MLIGGGESNSEGEHDATGWLLKRADGGIILCFAMVRFVLKPSGSAIIYDSLISSAAELTINTREAADDPDVEQYIRDAEALFIAGGD